MPGDVRLTPEADEDLASISEFTHDRFGQAQAKRYRDGLLKAIRLLVIFPMLGTDQGALRSGLRRLVHASHGIYYRVIGDDIIVSRILGPGQDPTREFDS